MTLQSKMYASIDCSASLVSLSNLACSNFLSSLLSGMILFAGLFGPAGGGGRFNCMVKMNASNDANFILN